MSAAFVERHQAVLLELRVRRVDETVAEVEEVDGAEALRAAHEPLEAGQVA
jgi:hypothetical protein